MNDLQEEIYAIEYEHWMLIETAKVFSPASARLDAVRRNALVESHAVHLRNLIEFLFHHKKKHTNDIRARDYVEDWCEVKQPAHLGKIYGRATEEIAHISKGRLTQAKTRWKAAYAEEVDRYFRQWLARTTADVQKHFVAGQARHHGHAVPVAHSLPPRATTTSTTEVNTITTPPRWTTKKL